MSSSIITSFILFVPAVPSEIIDLAQQRVVAKTEKRYQDADAIRNRVMELGFEIKDKKGGEFDIIRRSMT
jgi:cysteinyl-tRNA synthetase